MILGGHSAKVLFISHLPSSFQKEIDEKSVNENYTRIHQRIVFSLSIQETVIIRYY